MASIRKLPSGSWNVQIRHKGCPAVSKTFPSKKEATAWVKQFNSELTAQGRPLQPLFASHPSCPSANAKATLAEALQRYSKEITVNKRGHKEELYRMRPIRKNLGHLLMAEIQPHHIAQYRDFRLNSINPRGTKVTGDTVRRELALLSHLFNIARVDWGWASFIEKNPVSLVRKPQPNKSRSRRVTEEELKLILDLIPQASPAYPVVQLAYFTAMRRGEIMNIAWEDVDLESRVVYLPITKNGDPRHCPLSTKALSVLRQWKQENPTDHPRDKLFKINPDTVSHVFTDACRRAGLEDVRFHDLRHSATSNFIEQGLSIMEASSITGHKSFTMLKRYTHLNASTLAEKLG